MSVSPRSVVASSALSRSVIVTRLRAAGCVFAEDEAELLISTARTPDDLTAMVERRVAGLPLEHVLGWAEFCVRNGLIPRVSGSDELDATVVIGTLDSTVVIGTGPAPQNGPDH
jgi:hypothetical protein